MAAKPTEPKLINQKSLRDLATMLVRDAGITEGLFDISFEIQIAIGSFGPQPGDVLPGALVGVKSVGLLQTDKMNAHTVDASTLVPKESGRALSAPSAKRIFKPAKKAKSG